MLWVALIIGLILIYLFRKQVAVIAGIVVLMAAVVILYMYNEDKELEYDRDLIKVHVKYDEVVCSPDKPLQVIVENTSPSVAKVVKWNVEVFRPGYSANIVKGASGGDPWSTPYRIDTPLKEMSKVTICYSVPTLNEKSPVSQLLYRIANKAVELAD